MDIIEEKEFTNIENNEFQITKYIPTRTIIKPSYYAIIPASIRYDNAICPNAKLLYGEITALTNAKGFCWAGNEYFAKLYNVEKRTITRWVKQLEKAGYITCKVSKNEYNCYQRSICIDKKIMGSGQKDPSGIDKKIYNNNININNTINKYSADIIKIIDHLNLKAGKKFTYKNTSYTGHIKARLKEGFTAADFIKVIDYKCEDKYFKENPKYLNPDTLFRASNFEKYLNEVPAPAETQAEIDARLLAAANKLRAEGKL